jgi:hypothetical protein
MLSGLFILLPLMLLWIGLKELVRMCRYITRPAVVVPRVSLSSTGKVVYTLKTIYDLRGRKYGYRSSQGHQSYGRCTRNILFLGNAVISQRWHL